MKRGPKPKFESALCHPNRDHFALGLCKKCYNRKYYLENRIKYIKLARKYYRQNRVKCNRRAKLYNATHRKRINILSQIGRVKRQYGLTLTKYQKLRQGNCKICKLHRKKMVIDHNKPSSYRGVLCLGCNSKLGWYERHRVRIDSYL